MADLFSIEDVALPDLSSVGRGIPSGDNGLWRSMMIAPEALPFVVLYDSGNQYNVFWVADWDKMPREGLQAIVCRGGIWWCCDTYRLCDRVKYGTYMDDGEHEALMARARVIARLQGERARG